MTIYETIKSNIDKYHQMNCNAWNRLDVYNTLFSRIRKECSAGNITWDERIELMNMLND